MRNINVIKRSAKYKHIYKEIKVGDYYQDCGLHPVLCTENNGYDVEGISLIDGSYPRCCSLYYCDPRKITFDEALTMKMNWEETHKQIEEKFKRIGWDR